MALTAWFTFSPLPGLVSGWHVSLAKCPCCGDPQLARAQLALEGRADSVTNA